MFSATSSDTSGIRAVPLLLAFLLIAGLMGADLAQDFRAGSSPAHLSMEAVVMGIAGVSALGLGVHLRRERRRATRALEDARQLARVAEARAQAQRAEAERWRQEAQAAIEGLSAAIDRQFERWQLTPAEQEVALLLLKGLSTKEIATLRDTSDRTVRQQARAVYQKGGLAGRAELAAFFLEDLMAPRGG